MLRRNARLRREYLYRKSLEGKERSEYERKRVIREALQGEELWRESEREERARAREEEEREARARTPLGRFRRRTAAGQQRP